MVTRSAGTTLCRGAVLIEYRIDPELRLVIAWFTGEVEYEELLNWHLELAGHPDYHPDFSGVGDMRRASMQVSHEQIEALDRLNAERKIVTGAWALLVDSPRETALAMVYSNVKAGRHPMHYFSTIEAASEYLGVDVSPYFS